jgi:hypothetical protein
LLESVHRSPSIKSAAKLQETASTIVPANDPYIPTSPTTALNINRGLQAGEADWSPIAMSAPKQMDRKPAKPIGTR